MKTYKITKGDKAEYESICIAANKLNNRIEKLFERTHDMNHLPNHLAILHHSFKLQSSLLIDYSSVK